VLGRNLAREAHVPSQYLSKIMGTLRHAGLVDAARGTKGGYRLTRPAAEIRLREVVEVFEGPVDRPDCLLGVNPECSDASPCPAHAPWKRLREAYVQFLEETTVGNLAASSGSATEGEK
jgi:Rrf2 family protein